MGAVSAFETEIFHIEGYVVHSTGNYSLVRGQAYPRALGKLALACELRT